MAIERSSGILLPIFSLPSAYGIGTLGKAAYDFIDFLEKAKQSWWQILPVGPTSYGDSPYQSYSTFAGNPYFIDLDMLCEDGLLKKNELEGAFFGDDPNYIDYSALFNARFKLLQLAFSRGSERDRAALEEFERSKPWLQGYALFMACKNHFGSKAFYEWDDKELSLHKPEAVKKYSELLSEDVLFYKYLQLLFFRQWDALSAYAHSKGIGIIGDLPIYVAPDSADVWAEPDCFLLDEQNRPTSVAGVPPDYFSRLGQLWGNPLYNWEKMKADGYGWWIRRVDGASKLYDVLRIDHFRGLESFWAIPSGEKTAVNGKWIKGPGIEFVKMLTSWFYGTEFIAEDLGILTPEVRKLLADSGLPGMKMLEFAFEPSELSSYLPHTYTENCVCYTGTHDNTTLSAWLSEADPLELDFAKTYLGLSACEGYENGVIRGGMSSAAALFIAQLQDYLKLGSEARINTPGTLGGNWQWRLSPDMLSDALAESIAYTTTIYGRSKTAEK